MPSGLAELGDAVSCSQYLDVASLASLDTQTPSRSQPSPFIVLHKHLLPSFRPLAHHSTTFHKRAYTPQSNHITMILERLANSVAT